MCSNYNLTIPVDLKVDINAFCKIKRRYKSQLIHKKINNVTEELIEYLVQLILNSEPRYGTADLAAELGEDCFGMYLPMHAFFKSEKTPYFF